MSLTDRQTPARHPPRPAAALEAAAVACILAVMVARPFMAEMGFRAAQRPLAAIYGHAEQAPHPPPQELVRLSCAVILLAAAALWALAQAARRQWQLSGAIFGIGLVAFAAWSFVSAWKAPDARGGLTGWVEQVSIILGGFVMLQLARQGRRRMILLTVLAALAGSMGLKAIAQEAFELPATRAEFLANPAEQLADHGIRPGTMQARMFRTRLLDPACFGYLSLSNMLASLMLPLLGAAAALAIERIARARRDRKRVRLARGQVHLPTLAAVVAAALAALAAAGLLLTRSKGGMAAAAAALVATIVVARQRAFFAGRRRAALLACGIVTLAAVAATAGVGVARGSLPGGQSMKVRWEYWAGSAGLIKESPVWGAGPGNFSHGYLPHRLPAAGESPKTAHNVLVDAACAYGLAGGAMYLGMLVWMLAALTLPPPAGGAAPDPAARAGGIRWCVFLPLAVLAARAAWVAAESAPVLIIEAVLPAAVFAGLCVAAMWTGGLSAAPAVASPAVRIALVAGLAGMAAHNLVSYSLFFPATATVFWVVSGAVAAGRLPLRRLGRAWAVAVAAAAVIATAAAGLWLWRPIYKQAMHVRAAERAATAGEFSSTVKHMIRAAQADDLDGLVPADLAKLWLSRPRDESPSASAQATAWAGLAWRRMPTAAHAALLAEALWRQGAHEPELQSRAVSMAAKAVAMDPMDLAIRTGYAGKLCSAGRYDQAAQQVERIRWINSQRPPDGDLRLSAAELAALDALQERINRTSQ